MLYPLIQFHRTSIIKSVVEKEKKKEKNPFDLYFVTEILLL